MCKILSRILVLDGFSVTCFCRPAEAIEYIRRTPPDLVLTDMKMPEITGMEVVRATHDASPGTGIVIMTAYGTIEGAIDAMRAGAFDYVRKPFQTDELLITLTKALEQRRLLVENETLNETLRRQTEHTQIIGTSPLIQEVVSLIGKAAPTSSAVLIYGESGTGKELVAKAIHKQSPRRKKSFVAINCASIPEPLLESELFGHEKGSFTGADRTKMGLIELAHEGTLFLDEIGDLPFLLQSKLLRVLQEHEIQRVGGLRTIPVDVRLLAATNRDLKSAIDMKEFRTDLFYRLNVITITLPPLRDRVGDIPVLVEHFLEQTRIRLRKPRASISEDAMRALEQYHYPGNVRELENIIERMIVLCDSNSLGISDIPADIRSKVSTSYARETTPLQHTDYREAREEFERAYLLKVIETTRGNISEAARLSGLSRRHFHEKIDKLKIRPGRSGSS